MITSILFFPQQLVLEATTNIRRRIRHLIAMKVFEYDSQQGHMVILDRQEVQAQYRDVCSPSAMIRFITTAAAAAAAAAALIVRISVAEFKSYYYIIVPWQQPSCGKCMLAEFTFTSWQQCITFFESWIIKETQARSCWRKIHCPFKWNSTSKRDPGKWVT